ncbi:MAG: octaprenyl diphosphate synthase, partial [Pseudomonadales bacterium]
IGGRGDTETIMATVKNSGALEYTQAKAVECIDLALQCLDCLPENDFKNGLAAVADAALNRQS